jgi:hypothetical protein
MRFKPNTNYVLFLCSPDDTPWDGGTLGSPNLFFVFDLQLR